MTEVVDLEVIIKVKIEACYMKDANSKKVQELIDEYGLELCSDPAVLFTTVKQGDEL